MFCQLLFLACAFALGALSCPDHDFHESGSALQKRAEGQDWAYEASYNWGMINESENLMSGPDNLIR
jgi:carbonic anhydrase